MSLLNLFDLLGWIALDVLCVVVGLAFAIVFAYLLNEKYHLRRIERRVMASVHRHPRSAVQGSCVGPLLSGELFDWQRDEAS